MDSGICEKDSKGGRAGGVLPLTATLSLMESRPLFFRMHWDHEPTVTNSCYTCNMYLPTSRSPRIHFAPCAPGPCRRQRRAGVSPAQFTRPRERGRSVAFADGGRRDARPTLRNTSRCLGLSDALMAILFRATRCDVATARREEGGRVRATSVHFILRAN